jgi:hypothetical protein
MSTASVPGQYPVGRSHARLPHLGYESGGQGDLSADEAATPINVVTPLRSRFQTGQALEILGHAVEYLVDSRMFLVDEPATRADSEALHILMRLSREVFQDRSALLSSGRRLRSSTSNHFAAN